MILHLENHLAALGIFGCRVLSAAAAAGASRVSKGVDLCCYHGIPLGERQTRVQTGLLGHGKVISLAVAGEELPQPPPAYAAIPPRRRDTGQFRQIWRMHTDHASVRLFRLDHSHFMTSEPKNLDDAILKSGRKGPHADHLSHLCVVSGHHTISTMGPSLHRLHCRIKSVSNKASAKIGKILSISGAVRLSAGGGPRSVVHEPPWAGEVKMN